MKSGVAPESSIRRKLDGKAVFFGVAPNQKNGGKNFGGGKQEGNSLRDGWGATRPKGRVAPHTPSLHTLTSPKGFGNSLNNPHTDTPPP